MSLSLAQLRGFVADAAALRSRTTLQPAGGEGDKVFPPTYAVDKGSKYVTELRRIDGESVPCVLLDSVPSQANRHELALLQAYRDDGAPVPYVALDFRDEEGIADLGEISFYEAPHRVADALLRDGLLDGVPFRASPLGRSFTDARPDNDTPMYRVCPHALVFGVWDSTGPRGGLGSKFARAMTSEVVGIGVEAGRKTASRIDPASIAAGVTIFEDAAGDWTLDEADAAKDKKGQAVKRGTGRASEINHGNIAPSIDEDAGGVTIDRAVQTWVLSLAGLRRLRFPTATDGTALEGATRREAELAARTALAALSLVAASYARRDGFDLRSRSVLVPEGPQVFEALGADGGEPTTFALSVGEARALLEEAVAAAEGVGMGWDRAPVLLRPMPKLAELIRRSRALHAASSGEEA